MFYAHIINYFTLISLNILHAFIFIITESPVSCTDKHRTISDTVDIGEHVLKVQIDNVDNHNTDSSISFVSVNQSLPFTIDRNTGSFIPLSFLLSLILDVLHVYRG